MQTRVELVEGLCGRTVIPFSYKISWIQLQCVFHGAVLMAGRCSYPPLFILIERCLSKAQVDFGRVVDSKSCTSVDLVFLVLLIRVLAEECSNFGACFLYHFHEIC